jgi:L-ascorbate metabolism protein UlaG (beta-lactamase superfamily)
MAAALVVGAIATLPMAPGAALANCLPVAQAPGLSTGLMRASAAGPAPATAGSFLNYFQRAQGLPTAPPSTGSVEITLLGHSSFLIRTPKGVSAITDYNGYIRSPLPPDIVTMNHAHDSHYTDIIEPGVKHVLRGWTTADGGYPRYNLTLRDMRVRNVATNIRGIEGGTEIAGNSIFIFESNQLCIAHLGHLHHQLTKDHLARIGAIDILFVAIDDGSTMPQADYAEVIRALNPRVIIPMHFFDQMLLDQFLNLMEKQRYGARMHASPTIRFTKRTLPRRTVVVLPGGGF